MSRITSHCVCQNTDEHNDTTPKVYSLLPNYFKTSENNCQSPELCTNTKDLTKFCKSNRQYDCNVCKNYENIEQFISGTFRPHSCPTEDNDSCARKQENNFLKESLCNNSSAVTQINQQNNERYHRKYSKSSLKPEKTKFHDHVYVVKNTVNDSGPQRLDTIHQGINLFIDNGHLPILANVGTETIKKSQKETYTETSVDIGNHLKKPSCGLKYIIFQKLSIMSHFLTKSKSKSSSVSMSRKQLSDENLFKENQCQTKRSKSFHTINTKNNRASENECARNSLANKVKQRLYKTKESDTSNSSTGSIDAHAGSPITIMTSMRGKFLGSDSKTIMGNKISGDKKSVSKNEWNNQYASPEMRELSQKRYHHQQRQSVDKTHSDQCFIAHQHYHCPTCIYTYQHAYHPMHCDQICRSLCYSPSPIQSQFSPYHCCCYSHSHIVMHQNCSQSPPPRCCDQSSYCCHCCKNVDRNCCQKTIRHYDLRARSSLCHSCQSKNVKRCQSESFSENRRSCEHSNQDHVCSVITDGNVQCNQRSESKVRLPRQSPSSHSKSATSSIPPPPPPPPSSLYSVTDVNEPMSHKTKHKKHGHAKVGKLCENCNVIIPRMAHSPDCTNNVQNIIYSHLNDTVACTVSKDTQGIFNQSLPKDERGDSVTKDIKYKTAKGQHLVRHDKENDKDNNFYPSKRHGLDCVNQKEIFDRRSAEIQRENSITYKTNFKSKTPETYKSKNDRRHKKHQYDNQRISKHKSISTTREYKFVEDKDLHHRDDSLDSPEAGSFIYHPRSPLLRSTGQTIIPKNVSSFNRQHCIHKDISYGRTELVRKAFQENMLSLKEVGWYWGPLSFTEAESLMENKANGTFLVRDSGHDTYFLSLTFRVRETTFHTRIEYSQGTFSFWSQPESHSATTIVEFIDKAVAHSQSGKFHYFLLTNVPGQPPMEVSLLYPLSRHQIVHSLKHLSRFVILTHIRKDHITDLSVPTALRSYLLEKQYYISNLDEFIEMTADSHPLSYKPSMIN